MGGAARWFKGLFRKKKRFVSSDDFDKGGEDSDNCNFPTDPVCLRHFLTDTEKEQNKHAIAVATATATAAKAAVSAAKAAAAVVRLTTERKEGNIITREERWAAVKIQKVFRGSLARKALRALKGIVKLQALVRGYLVRKRAAAVLHSIQALIRIQTSMRSKHNRCLNKDYTNMFQHRHSLDEFDEVAHDERRPKIVEMDDVFKRRPKSRQIHSDATMSEYDDGFVYRRNDLELKFETAHNTPRFSSSSKCSSQNTPRFSSSSHQHNRYYIMQSPSRSVCGNALCDYGVSSPGYMEKTQSFKEKNQRSHSAPHRRSERKRLSLDEVIESRSSVSVESLLQQEQQRYSCS